VRATITPKASDPLGQVTGGSLILRAHVRYLSRLHGQDWKELLDPNDEEGDYKELYRTRVDIMLDFDELETLREIWLLYVSCGESLVLRKEVIQTTFQRVGIFREIAEIKRHQYWHENGHNRTEIQII